MVRLYCRKKEGNSELCDSCRQLLAYAESRLEHCPFGERKTSCRRCTVHCYKPSMRQQMREVMRFSGPRMIFYEPLETIRHIFKYNVYLCHMSDILYLSFKQHYGK